MAGRELGVLRVVERRIHPGGCIVAVLAGCGEELRLRCVAGIGRVVVVGLMASKAHGRQRCVIAIDMAIAALPGRHGVRTSEGEGRVVVIKHRVCPDVGVMTTLTGRRKSRHLMNRVIRAGVVLLMTRVADRAVERVVAADVAI